MSISHLSERVQVSPGSATFARREPQEVAQDLLGLPLSLVNVYFVGPPGAQDRGWVLIDTGLATSRSAIRRTAAQRFGSASRPAAILLTHGHFDHVGSVRSLAELWDCPVYAHELELPYLTGRSSYPPPDPTVGGGAMSALSRFYPRGPINLGARVQRLPMDGAVPHLSGWRWVATPGHTPGHVSFFRDADRALVAGDAFVAVAQESALSVLFQQGHVHRPPAYYTPDWESARQSVRTLSELQPDIAATGHGPPLYGEALRAQLDELLVDWDTRAVPPQGRYVRAPAVANHSGVVHVPPPTVEFDWTRAAALGVLGLAGAMWLRSRRRSITGPQPARK